MIKHLSIFLMLFLTTTMFAQPQEKGRRSERVKAHRTQFINNELALTEAEKEKFWPIYNQYSKEKKALRKDKPSKKKIDTMTDQELEQLLEYHLNIRAQKIALQRKLYQDLKQAIPLIKIAKLPRVEKRFKHNLVKHAKGKKAKKQRKH